MLKSELPTADTVANLAATLAAALIAAGRSVTGETIKTLAAQSVDLWVASKDEISRRVLVKLGDELSPPRPPAEAEPIPDTKIRTHCPVTFQQILKGFMPEGDSYTDREKRFRDFLKATSPSTWEAEMSKWKTTKGVPLYQIDELREAFLGWQKLRASEVSSLGGKAKAANVAEIVNRLAKLPEEQRAKELASAAKQCGFKPATLEAKILARSSEIAAEAAPQKK